MPVLRNIQGSASPLKLDSMEVYVDPRAEWRQMHYQVWRDERDFLYDDISDMADMAVSWPHSGGYTNFNRYYSAGKSAVAPTVISPSISSKR